MNNFPQQKLQEIIRQYGVDIYNNPQRCEGLLRDFCGQYQKEIAVLVGALKDGVPSKLQNSKNSVPHTILLAQLAKKLQDDLGLAEEAAIWAVESWALALEVISVVSPSQSQKEPSRSKEETHQINNPVKVNPETQKEEQERQRVEKERFDAEKQARVETERKQRQQVEKQRFEKEKEKEKLEAETKTKTKTRHNNRIVGVLLGFCLCLGLGWLGGTIIFFLVQPQKSIIIGNSSASPSASSSASPNEPLSLNELAGEYKVVLDPKVLADAEKEGVKSVTGKWTIKADGSFEATLKAVSTKDEVQEIKTVGKITIEDGKVISQVETVNGEKPTQTPPKQPYTLSADGKELQADGQPVKLVKQRDVQLRN